MFKNQVEIRISKRKAEEIAVVLSDAVNHTTDDEFSVTVPILAGRIDVVESIDDTSVLYVAIHTDSE
jgi:hypothetical protein